jgi:BolA protein
MGAIRDRIETKLTAAFQPTLLDIEDQSESHRGHAGFQEGGETHFHVRIVAPSFAGQSRVTRQRAVYAALKDELAERVHALSMEAKAPGE